MPPPPVPKKRNTALVAAPPPGSFSIRDTDGRLSWVDHKRWKTAIKMHGNGRCDVTIAKAIKVQVWVVHAALAAFAAIANEPERAARLTEDEQWMLSAFFEWHLGRRIAISKLMEVAYDKAKEGSLGHLKLILNQEGELAPDPGAWDPNTMGLPKGGSSESKLAALRNSVEAMTLNEDRKRRAG